MRLPVVIAFLVSAAVARAEIHSHQGWEVCACKRELAIPGLRGAADPVSGNGRQYARDREIDVRHLKLELTPDFDGRGLSGISTMEFSPIAKPLRQLRLDAVDLDVSKVAASHPIEDWEVGERKITITFRKAIPAGTDASVTVAYSAEPLHGWYYRTEAMGYPEGDDHFWTQGEPEKHRHWFPGYDYPNERFTSEVICEVPKGMTVLSNGRLVSEGTLEGKSTFHWLQEEEHVNYLISVVGGHFKKLEDSHGNLPLAFYTPPSEFAVAENSFRDTAKILPFLEKEIGVKFPWAKYYNVCVADFIAGGMENTSLTTLTTRTLFHDSSENLKTSHRLDAHEATHQWFGDLLTCKDWSHLWLNEGFATYYTHLYENEKNGREAMLYGLYRDSQGILSNNDEKPIVWREYKDPFEQFDYRAYPKGSWVLHMLRSQLGPELYRDCIRTYVERNRNKNVVTHDLISVIEELSGRSWDEYFDQWVFHGGEPNLKVGYAWDQTRGQAKLSISQAQKVSDKVLLFDFPLPVRFIDEKGGVHDFTVRIHETTDDFFFDLPVKPKIVRIDPELTVLAAIDFKPANPQLFAQLENQDDMMGRLLAVKQLGGQKDSRSLDQLKAVLNGDSFHGVRIEAAKALTKTHTPKALEILTASIDQADARVRQEVVRGIGKFFDEEAFAALKGISEKEENPEIIADALGAIGKFPQEKVDPVLMAALDRDSYRNRIAAATIRAMRTQAEPGYAGLLLKHLKDRESDYQTRDFGSGLDTLAYLVRNQEDAEREPVREFIADFLGHPKESLRPQVVAALGTLEDRRSIPLLQAIVDTGNRDLPEYKAAEEAIKKLNARKEQATEVKDLRNEVLELQKQLREMQGKLETIQKQAAPKKPEESKPAEKKQPPGKKGD